MKTVNVQEAKTHLSRLLAQVAAGETIVIGKAGQPIATLSAWQPATTKRKGGGWASKIRIAKDFDTPDDEIEHMFEDTGLSNIVSTVQVAENPPDQLR